MKKIMLLSAVLMLLSCSKPVPLKEEVRGVWVPDPQYTDVLKSYQNVVNFVSLLDSLHFNSMYVVSYALSKTLYPSQVMMENTNYSHIDSTNMLAPFRASYNTPTVSPSGDPVRDLIDEAHKRNIKVFFWYEFGFMADIKLATPENNPLLAKNPTWVGIGNDGKPANYNNHDYYFNSFDPAVQNYLLRIVEEGVKLYPDVDGIQGDDRLPAMCVNSGYDPITVARYRKEHNGANPPADFNDSTWVRWRLDILNTFGKTLYDRVKSINPRVMVSFAPNPYPWCQEKLLQDWPQWVNSGICDLLAVQCYRYDSIGYRNTVAQAQTFIKPKPGSKQLFVPGIILMVSGKISDAQQIKKQVLINRELKTNGEIFFYNEGLRKPEIRAVIRELYPEKAEFPKLQ